MKRATFVGLVGSVFLLTANCQQSGPGGSEASGGSGGTTTGAGGTGGTNDSGGSGGSGGTSGSGGSTSSGGTTTSSGGSSGEGGGAGGTDENGGSSGNGGDTGSGGARTGGSTTARGGSGGTTPAGGTTGSGGANAGGTTTARGGTTGSGGAANTGGTTASTGGTTGSGGSTGSLADTVVPDLAKGFYWEGSCKGSISVTGKNCPMLDSGSCPSNGQNRDVTFKVGGEASKKYSVTIEVRGVAGTRCYKGGTRASSAAPKEDDYNNWWYIGGSYANPTGWWNTYELQVTPATGDADVYYFNASDVEGGNYCEREASYLVGYSATFKVVGGGSLRFRIHDQNCKALQNCGKDIDPNSACVPRKVDLASMPVQPPTSSPAAAANQPPKNQLEKTYYPQWMWVVAKSVTAL